MQCSNGSRVRWTKAIVEEDVHIQFPLSSIIIKCSVPQMIRGRLIWSRNFSLVWWNALSFGPFLVVISHVSTQPQRVTYRKEVTGRKCVWFADSLWRGGKRNPKRSIRRAHTRGRAKLFRVDGEWKGEEEEVRARTTTLSFCLSTHPLPPPSSHWVSAAAFLFRNKLHLLFRTCPDKILWST